VLVIDPSWALKTGIEDDDEDEHEHD